MKRYLKYSFTVILIVLLSMSGLSYFIFDWAQIEIRTESKNKAANGNQNDTITLSIAGFKALPNKHEIWVNGSLYDVSHFTFSGDSVCLIVFHDNDEEDLIHVITESFDSGNSVAENSAPEHYTRHKIHNIDNNKILPDGVYLSVHTEVNSIKIPDGGSMLYSKQSYPIFKPPSNVL